MIPFPNNVAIESMTLRDYFAALAMQGLLACEKYCDFSCKDIAEIAYKQADEMLEEREYAQ
jgi:hypothetical protein